MDMQAPAGGNMDRGPQAIAIFWAEAAIALIVVALRIWGRAMIHQLGADDYIMVFTLVSLLSPATRRFEGQRPSNAAPDPLLDPLRLHNILCYYRWPETPILFGARAAGAGRQVQLDYAAVVHLWLRNRQDLCRPPYSAVDRAQHFLAQVDALWIYGYRLRIQRARLYPHVCAM
jgi:hypothetical protein